MHNLSLISGLQANPENFQAMILGKKNYNFTFMIGNVEIDERERIDLLGVDFDNKPTYIFLTSVEEYT